MASLRPVGAGLLAFGILCAVLAFIMFSYAERLAGYLDDAQAKNERLAACAARPTCGPAPGAPSLEDQRANNERLIRDLNADVLRAQAISIVLAVMTGLSVLGMLLSMVWARVGGAGPPRPRPPA